MPPTTDTIPPVSREDEEWMLDYHASWLPPLENIDELLNDYIPAVLGIRVPDWPMCDEHDTPADFLRAACALRTLGAEWRYLHRMILYVSCRTGGKSQKAAMVKWLRARRWRGYQGRILAGSGDQAGYCYQHSQEFWHECDGRMKCELDGDPLRERTTLLNGSMYGILKASMASVRGAHPNDLAVDELDEVMSAIFEASMGQPKRSKGIDSQRLFFSTINYPGGLVETLVDEAEQREIKVILHCWKEVTKTCELDTPCPECVLYPKCNGDLKHKVREAIIVENRDELLLVAVKDSNGVERVTEIPAEAVDDGIDTTTLEPGDRIEVRGNPQGYLETDEVITYYNAVSEETWDSEMDCNPKKPRGRVLKRHQIDACVAKVKYDPKMLYTWAGFDWGYVNETSMVVVQWDGKADLRIVAEAHWTEMTDDEYAEVIDAIGERFDTKEGYADAEDPGKIKALRKLGWKMHPVAFNPWKGPCLEALRVWLRGAGGRRFQINENLTHLLKALRGWRYKKQVIQDEGGSDKASKAIEKKGDHPCDATLAAMRRFAVKKRTVRKPQQRQERFKVKGGVM